MPTIDHARLSPNPLFAFLERQGPLLTADEEARLGRAALSGCRRSRNELVERNLRLVIDLVKKSGYRDENELLDRIQEGAAGLMRAAERFDPARGCRFSTYATWWVRQAITRERDGKQPVHVPLSLVSELRSTETMLAEALGRTPSAHEIADALGIPVVDVVSARAPMRPHSLDVPVGEDGNSTLGDFIADERGDDPVAAAEHLDLRDQVAGMLSRLMRKERAVIRLRFGFETGTPEPFSTVCKAMGIPLDEARRLEAHALRALREQATADDPPPPMDLPSRPRESVRSLPAREPALALGGAR